jgi:hypothetical protein
VAFPNIIWPFTSLQALSKESVPSYDLLSELPLKHKSYNHNNSLPEHLLIITPINTSSITRTRQTKHIKDETKAITVAEVSEKALETAVTSEARAVFVKAEAVADITHLHVRKSVISATNQVVGQQNTLLKSRSKRTTSLASTLSVFIRNPQLYTIRTS